MKGLILSAFADGLPWLSSVAYDAGMLNDEDKAGMLARMHELKVEHRDLDDVIDRLLESPPPHDELLLRRLKKRKLYIKDRITQIEQMLEPDELA